MDKNHSYINQTVGSLKTLLYKGENFMFIDHHINEFLECVMDQTTAYLYGETLEKLTQLSLYAENHKVELNTQPFMIFGFEKALQKLKPIINEGYTIVCMPLKMPFEGK